MNKNIVFFLFLLSFVVLGNRCYNEAAKDEASRNETAKDNNVFNHDQGSSAPSGEKDKNSSLFIPPPVISGGGMFREHFCMALPDKQVACWGADDFGELGRDEISTSPIPKIVKNVGDARGVTAGNAFSCAYSPAGAWCWGSNQSGQLGFATNTEPNKPTLIPVPSIKTLVSYKNRTCVVNGEGNIFCFGGWNEPNGDFTRHLPTQVQGITGVIQVALGENHGCGLKADGSVWCFGSNDSGQLGDGTREAHEMPVEVKGIKKPVSFISAGGNTTCAISQGQAYCWGFSYEQAYAPDTNGRNGRFVNIDQLSPHHITSRQIASPITYVSVGSRHACMVEEKGDIWCWGAGGVKVHGAAAPSSYSLLGVGVENIQFEKNPVQVNGIHNALGVAVADQANCAWLKGGGAKCWGDGLQDNQSLPVFVKLDALH